MKIALPQGTSILLYHQKHDDVYNLALLFEPINLDCNRKTALKIVLWDILEALWHMLVLTAESALFESKNSDICALISTVQLLAGNILCQKCLCRHPQKRGFGKSVPSICHQNNSVSIAEQLQ